MAARSGRAWNPLVSEKMELLQTELGGGGAGACVGRCTCEGRVHIWMKMSAGSWSVRDRQRLEV